MSSAQILIVEDENIVAKDLQMILKRLGYCVTGIVPTGEEAIERAQQDAPDLVLMDIVLRGEIDGIQAAEVIRQTCEIPIVYLTAHADPFTLQRAKITDPFGYVLKPFEERELHTAIEMAVHKHRMEQELRQSQQWLDTTLRSIGDAVIATDSRGCVMFMNPLAESLTGWSEEDAIGHSLSEVFVIINEHTRESAANPTERVLRDGIIVGLANHTLLISRDGREHPIDDSAAPIRDPNGKIHGVVLVFRDVSERRRLQSELEAHTRQLEESARRKDEFLAMLAHELRNPLAPIRTGLELLACGEQHLELVDMMKHQVDHLVRLVDDLLDISRITRGQIELRREIITLQEICNRATETVRPMITERGQQIQVSLPPDPVLLLGDRVRLTQVLANLLNNACKYGTRGGHIWLTADCQNQRVTIRVRDDGIGIDNRLLPTVFDLFTQGDRSLERSQGGLGIGLTLVQSLVRMHGGTVAAQSDGLGCGSEFMVELPVAIPESCEPSREDVPLIDGEPLSPRRVLVVDDSVASAKTLAALLRLLWHHEVMLAADGPGALETALQFRPDIVLLDVGLPGMSGYEVARRIREMHELNETFLVALTGYGTEEDRQRAQAAGFDTHLVKPASLETLREVLARRREQSHFA